MLTYLPYDHSRAPFPVGGHLLEPNEKAFAPPELPPDSSKYFAVRVEYNLTLAFRCDITNFATKLAHHTSRDILTTYHHCLKAQTLPSFSLVSFTVSSIIIYHRISTHPSDTFSVFLGSTNSGDYLPLKLILQIEILTFIFRYSMVRAHFMRFHTHTFFAHERFKHASI